MGDEAVELAPRIGVVICDCGERIAQALDTEALCQHATRQPEVRYAARDTYPCSKDGQERLRKAISEHQLERVLIAGCSSRLVEKLFRQAAAPTGLEPNAVDVVNIREHVAYVHAGDPAALSKAIALIEMGTARLATTTPAPSYTGRVVKSALVIGSGVSALTVALALADAEIRVILLEPSGALGESVPDLHTTTRQLISEKGQSVLKHPLIDILFNAILTEVRGHPGDYEVRIQHGDQTITYAIGAIIVDNGAQLKKLSTNRWFDRSKVKTQAEFENELVQATQPGKMLGSKDIVMIFCAEETQLERCSRVCCNIGIRQAISRPAAQPGCPYHGPVPRALPGRGRWCSRERFYASPETGSDFLPLSPKPPTYH